MILIKEQKPKKLPGETTFDIQFSFDQKIIDVIKNIEVYSYDKKSQSWEIPITSLSYILDSLCQIDDIQLEFLKIKDTFYKTYELNNHKTSLYPYQVEGVQFGLNKDRFLLLDAPGLGKSIQLIYLAEELKGKRQLQHCLIICGLNTLKFNWVNEIKKHSSLSCKILGQKISKNGKITIGSIEDRLLDLKSNPKEFFIITNIQTLRDDKIIKELSKNSSFFDMIVLDEAHVCKSPSSQQGKNLLKLTKAKYRIAATGTLLLNSPLDAYVPLKWIDADYSTFTNFKYYYCNYTGKFHNILTGYKHIDILKDQIEHNSLRRTKDLLDLPAKTIINEYVEMDTDQEMFYKNLEKGLVTQVDKVKITTTSLLAMIARLRQATAYPQSLTSENISSAKIVRACDLADQIIQNGSKVVIFSTFKDTLIGLEANLKHYNPLTCTGDCRDEEIAEKINLFQTNPEFKIMLATWQKMGTGITLTAASYAIFIDVPWTNGVYEQAQDRIYRIGSKNPVFIYHLITKDTIDEKVLSIVESKEALSDYVIDDTISDKSLEILKSYILDLVE